MRVSKTAEDHVDCDVETRQVAAVARVSMPRMSMFAASWSRNHWYVSRMPVSRSIFGDHPVAVRRVASSTLRGVPSGSDVSNCSSASG